MFVKIGDIDTLNEKFQAEALIEAHWEEPLLKIEVSWFKIFNFNILLTKLKYLQGCRQFWCQKVLEPEYRNRKRSRWMQNRNNIYN